MPRSATQTLEIEPYLIAWVKARCPALAGRVYPVQGVQDDAPPYCVVTTVAGHRYRDQLGPDGLSFALIRVDVWALLRAVATVESDRICGTLDDPGLDGYRGVLVADGAGEAFVQRIDAADGEEFFEPPEQGQPQGWQCARRDYRVFFEETLRAAP